MPKRDYKQFCPTARALNVIGERWTLLIVRDLMLRPRRYTDLRRSLPGMASNLLAVRLSEMEEAGLVVRQRVDEPSPRDVYALTDRGRDLEPLLLELARFGFPLLGVPTDEEPLVSDLVPLGLRAMMHEPELPDDGLRIRFALDEGHHAITIAAQGPPGRRLSPTERVSVTPLPDLGGDGDDAPMADVVVSGSLAGILWIQQGIVDLGAAERNGLIMIKGDDDARQKLRFLYRLDPVAA